MCTSGALTSNNTVATCANAPETTKAGFPHSCSSDNDCKGTLGTVVTGSCACYPNNNGSNWC